MTIDRSARSLDLLLLATVAGSLAIAALLFGADLRVLLALGVTMCGAAAVCQTLVCWGTGRISTRAALPGLAAGTLFVLAGGVGIAPGATPAVALLDLVIPLCLLGVFALWHRVGRGSPTSDSRGR